MKFVQNTKLDGVAGNLFDAALIHAQHAAFFTFASFTVHFFIDSGCAVINLSISMFEERQSRCLLDPAISMVIPFVTVRTLRSLLFVMFVDYLVAILFHPTCY